MNTQSSNQIEVITQALQELAQNKSSDVIFSNLRYLEFKAEGGDNYGKGLIFSGQGYTKQIVFASNPDQFFVSENVNLSKGKGIFVNNVPVLNDREIGASVTKSSLKELGRLRGLIVDGDVSINNYLYYNSSVDRLGLGTDAPNAALSIAEMGVEVMLGTSDDMGGMVGTHATTDFSIVTDHTARITVKGNGNIDLGNPNKNPAQVTVHGKLSVGVKVPDPAVDLHVAGPVRINNKIQLSADAPPRSGTYGVGDIVWNSAPTVGRFVGWVCLKAGSPGSWFPFGEIKERG